MCACLGVCVGGVGGGGRKGGNLETGAECIEERELENRRKKERGVKKREKHSDTHLLLRFVLVC